MSNEKKFVTYEEFGAVGDGKTNDFEAMMLAHQYANENKLPVKADGTKTYYISDTEKDEVARSIIIKTDTDFSGAQVIIDDTDITHAPGKKRNFNTAIFKVSPYDEKITLDEETVKKIGSLKKSDTKIDVGLGFPCMLIIYNENHRVYVRYGPNANAGSPQHELVLIDAEGNIDPSTPIMHDYEELTKIEAIKTDIPTLTIENGVFTQYASHISTTKILPDGTKQKNSAYFHRQLVIQRSNTVVRNIKNYVKGEITLEEQAQGMTGPAYKGFFTAMNANNVLIEDCVVTARRYYTPGTYGFGAALTNNIVLKNCTQTNFYLRDECGNLTTMISMEASPLTNKTICWGLGGTNFCKNMVYDSCEITRFDAHQGLCNGKIINSKLTMVNLIGYGDMLIENTTLELKDSTLFNLRTDYGSTWEGTVTIKDCTVVPNETVTQKHELIVCNNRWINHNFGYTCHVPNIILDNVSFKKDVPLYLLQYHKLTEDSESYCTELIGEKVLADGVTENKNPFVAPSFMKLINNKSGAKIRVKRSPFLKNTTLEGFEIED